MKYSSVECKGAWQTANVRGGIKEGVAWTGRSNKTCSPMSPNSEHTESRCLFLQNDPLLAWITIVWHDLASSACEVHQSSSISRIYITTVHHYSLFPRSSSPLTSLFHSFISLKSSASNLSSHPGKFLTMTFRWIRIWKIWIFFQGRKIGCSRTSFYCRMKLF